MSSYPRVALALLLGVTAVDLYAQGATTASAAHHSIPVLPLPRDVTFGSGVWPVPAVVGITVASDDEKLRSLAAFAVSMLGESGVRASVGSASGGLGLRLVPADAALGAEGYRLTVTTGGVDIAASSHAGLFYGLQTFRQLVDAAVNAASNARSIGAVTIVDAPRFGYRGLHLDVGRHFQPIAFVKRYIDLMARYKFNSFHWHLTEDQGWRIEIRKYPRLTEVGGCRAETMVARNFNPYVGDGTPHCGFYTQDQIREVVAYAAARFITVMPEIEMPGHTVAALAAYPELACTPGPFTVRTTWGVDPNILCPSERTFEFLQDVLTEVMALFPSRYIHIGGDEAPKDRWRASPVAQEIIRRENLRDEHGLQSWFIRRIENFLLANGRRLVGWDEILEGGLAPQATVMSWRGTAGGIDAARQGRDVIMTPNSHLYFDHYQGPAQLEPFAWGGMSTLENVYSYEPIPDALTPAEAQRILGAQANVWTEYLKTPQAVEYQAYPRAIALAEVTWSAREHRNWASFAARLPNALAPLERLGVNYRIPHVEGLDGDQLSLDATTTVRLRTMMPGATIRYTTDGSDPTAASPAYTGPFSIPVTSTGVVVTARAFTSSGRASPPRAARYTLTTHRVAESIPASALAPGLAYAYFEGNVRSARAVDRLTPVREGTVPAIARRGDESAERYGLRFSGYVRVPADAMYTFGLTSDDGSTLSIGDTVVVDNDGAHGAVEKTGMIALRTGVHTFTVRYFQGGGGSALDLRYRAGEGAWTAVPAEWYLRRR
jgi:hexosaminidase